MVTPLASLHGFSTASGRCCMLRLLRRGRRARPSGAVWALRKKDCHWVHGDAVEIQSMNTSIIQYNSTNIIQMSIIIWSSSVNVK